jgi:hypothetical protein
MSNEIMNKVATIVSEAEQMSEKEKLQLMLQSDLIDFLRNKMQKETSYNSLKANAARIALDRIIEGEDPDNAEAPPVSMNNLIRIIEVIGRLENESDSDIISVLRETQKTIININDQGKDEKPRTPELTKDEVEKTKSLLSVFNVIEEMKKTEFSDEEKK